MSFTDSITNFFNEIIAIPQELFSDLNDIIIELAVVALVGGLIFLGITYKSEIAGLF